MPFQWGPGWGKSSRKRRICNYSSTVSPSRYIVGSETAKFFGSWAWALRVTPILGIVAVVLIALIRDPERGQSEGSHHMQATSYREDIKDIVRNPSFMLSTAGFTCVAFVAGALAWWGPKFIYLGLVSQPGNENITLNE